MAANFSTAVFFNRTKLRGVVSSATPGLQGSSPPTLPAAEDERGGFPEALGSGTTILLQVRHPIGKLIMERSLDPKIVIGTI